MPHGDITHIDIPVSNHKASQEFYGKLFGWQFNEYPGFDLDDSQGCALV